MPNVLTAKVETQLKADPIKLAKDQPETDLISIAPGDVLTAGTATLDGAYYIVTEAALNGTPVPAHITFARTKHWGLVRQPEQVVPEQVEQPVPVAKAPEKKPSPAKPKTATAEAKISLEEKKPMALEMLAAGKSVSGIAKELRIGRASIKRWRDEA